MSPRQRLGHRGRVPAHMRLGLRCGARQRISALDVGSWCEVLSQGSSCGADGAPPAQTASANQRPPTRYPVDLRGKCFNCLSTTHRVATCKLPPRCLRCKGFRHLVRDYKQRRKVPPSGSSTVGAPEGRQRCPVWEHILGNRPHTQGDMSSAAGVVLGAAALCQVRPRAAAVGTDGRGVGYVGAD